MLMRKVKPFYHVTLLHTNLSTFYSHRIENNCGILFSFGSVHCWQTIYTKNEVWQAQNQQNKTAKNYIKMQQVDLVFFVAQFS